MQAFILERLYPTGWRRTGELFWRLSDAERESQRITRNHEARAARILSVRINPEAVLELTAESEAGEGNADAR